MSGVPYRSPKPRPPKPGGGKDVWDVVATLTVPFVTLVLGLLGAYATYTYNQAALGQQRIQAQLEREQRAADAAADRAQRRQQAAAAKLIADADQLQKLFVYIASPDAQKREFGYSMFDALGQRDLALRLIGLNRDKAGIQLLLRSQNDPRPEVRAAATETLQTLLTPEQKSAIGTAIRRLEGSAVPTSVRRMGGDVLFGTNGWQVLGGGLQRLLDRYCHDPAAQVRALCAPGTKIVRPVPDDQFGWLIAAAQDPAMHRAEAAEAASELDGTTAAAERIARSQGVRLPLGIAILSDTVNWLGASTADALARQTTAAAGGSPAGGIDEKGWIRAYLSGRTSRMDMTRPTLGRAVRFRNALYERLIEAGDWEMRAAPPVDTPAP